MAVTTVAYCSREDVMRSVDFAEVTLNAVQVDRAVQSTARMIEGHLHRVFYPNDMTLKWDWPNYQFAYPWRVWFDQWDLVALTQLQSPNGTVIPSANVILRPVNKKPGWPFTYLELDRSTSAAFGAGPTPQLAIWVTGTWGFTADTDNYGALAAAVTTTTAATLTVTDSSNVGAGDLIIIDTERMIVSDRAATATGLTQSGAGCTTASMADNALTTTGTGALLPGEVLLLDAERMLIIDVTSGIATVKRAWDGTVLNTHSAATVNAYRLLTVMRGQLGTTAATHLISAPVMKLRVPSLIRDLAIAESVNRVLQETSGYARVVGGGDNAMPASGAGLADLWDEATTVYGRKARIRAI